MAEGVTASLIGDDGSYFVGAAILRRRPHPRTGEAVLHLGVPDDALGFRPLLGVQYEVELEDAEGRHSAYVSHGAWLERVQSSWWFVLEG